MRLLSKLCWSGPQSKVLREAERQKQRGWAGWSAMWWQGARQRSKGIVRLPQSVAAMQEVRLFPWGCCPVMVPRHGRRHGGSD